MLEHEAAFGDLIAEIEPMRMNVNAPARHYPGTMDLTEFMGFLEMRPKEERWHLIEGFAVMMAPPSLAHQRIALNLCELLNREFVAQHRDLYAYHEIAIRLPDVINFQPEPDVVVASGIASYESFAEDFQLVAEILSPSNARAQIDIKLRRYREASHNLYVLVIEPREYSVEIYARSRGWEPVTRKRADDPLELPEFSLGCVVGDLYRGTPLDPHR